MYQRSARARRNSRTVLAYPAPPYVKYLAAFLLFRGRGWQDRLGQGVHPVAGSRRSLHGGVRCGIRCGRARRSTSIKASGISSRNSRSHFSVQNARSHAPLPRRFHLRAHMPQRGISLDNQLEAQRPRRAAAIRDSRHVRQQLSRLLTDLTVIDQRVSEHRLIVGQGTLDPSGSI